MCGPPRRGDAGPVIRHQVPREAWIFLPLFVRALGRLSTRGAIFFAGGREAATPRTMPTRGYWVPTTPSAAALSLRPNVMMTAVAPTPSGWPAWLYFFGAGI